MSEIELHRGTPFLSNAELNRLARQQELSVVLAKARIFDQICQAVALPADREAELIQTFLQEEAISNDSELEDYLALRGWQEADLIYVATKAERLQRFQQQVFGQEVELNYLCRKLDLDQVHYTMVCVEDADEAFEWHQRLLEGEAEPDQFPAVVAVEQVGGLTTGRYGPQSISQAHHSLISRLRVGEPAQVWPPFFSDTHWVVLQLDQRLGTPLNKRVYAELLDELFETWLNRRITQLLTGEEPAPLPLNLLSQPPQTGEVVPDEPASITSQIQAIAHLLKRNQTEAARQHAEALLGQHPHNWDVLLITHRVQHRCGRHQQALAIALRLIEQNPERAEGYTRGVQAQLLLNQPEQACIIFEAGQQNCPEPDQSLLITGLNANVAAQRFNQAENLGRTLHELAPDRIDVIEPYLHALIHNKRFSSACSIALDAANRQPDNVQFVCTAAKALMRSQRLEDCRWLLYRSITSQHKHNDLRQIAAELYHVESQLRQQRDPKKRTTGCDVLCIAANDAPNIHEFIHHHIYLGFKNIFIGINNSQDQTPAILEKIRAKYPQVHIIDVNPAANPFMQWGCYHRLYDTALDQSDSKYCLVIDIDEAWISDPFPQGIDTFLDRHAPFDAFSFHRLEAFDDVPLDTPLSRDATYRFSPWVKSLFRYDIPLSRIGLHGPILNGCEQDLTVRLGDCTNANTKETLHGVEVLGLPPDTSASTPNKPDQAWVIHWANRSETEDAPSQISANGNRDGRENRDNDEPETTAYVQQLIGDQQLEAYRNSLKLFIDNCQIEGLIREARTPFTPNAITNTLPDRLKD